MKSVLGLVGFCMMIAFGVCSISAGMCFAGFGAPNCEPTYAGYAEFYATLFACSFASCLGTWLVVSFAYVADKFLTKERN